MHMADTLVSVAVGTSMTVASTATVGYSIKKIKALDLSDSKIPMMGVMGAFIFAAQMINFTIPGTGSSGHIGGGILLAALLGPYQALLTITSVLLIQALFFADGGLLALGCNVFNLGIIPCFVAYPFIYKLILRKSITPKKLTLASIIATIVGLQLGAFAVVIETTISGITELPFTSFLVLMQPIHLAIGIIEGIITGAVLCFVFRMRKELITAGLVKVTHGGISIKQVLVIFALASLIIGGFLSYFASSKPDGLEWAIHGVMGEEEIANASDAHSGAQQLQDRTSFLPDYSFKGEAEDNLLGTGVSGVVGGIVTLAVVIAAGMAINKYKRAKPKV